MYDTHFCTCGLNNKDWGPLPEHISRFGIFLLYPPFKWSTYKEIGNVKKKLKTDDWHAERGMKEEMKIYKKEIKINMNKNTFFHIRNIVLCDHFGDIGFKDCVIGMEEKVRGKIWKPKNMEKCS